MRIATGRVVSGKIVLEGEPLEEGATVTVLAPENDESFELSPEEEALLLASLEETASEQFILASDLLRDLGQRS